MSCVKKTFLTRKEGWDYALFLFKKFGWYEAAYRCKRCKYYHLTMKQAHRFPTPQYYKDDFNQWFGRKIL